MKIELRPNEGIRKKGYANHFISHRMGITGTLYLTNQRLWFTTHPLNYKRYVWEADLGQIESVKLTNNLVIFTYGLTIQLRNGESHRFAVWRRKRWKKAIESACSA